MTKLHADDQIAALRSLVFGTIDEWNAEHPQRLRSHHERGSVSIAQVYGDAGGRPSYAVTVACALSGTAQLTFHGTDLAAVVEHARLTLEHKIEVELRRRAGRAHHGHAHERHHGVAV